MFENVINPVEGKWIRVAPYLNLLAIVVAFALGVAALASAVRASQVVGGLYKDAPADKPVVILVQNGH